MQRGGDTTGGHDVSSNWETKLIVRPLSLQASSSTSEVYIL